MLKFNLMLISLMVMLMYSSNYMWWAMTNIFLLTPMLMLMSTMYYSPMIMSSFSVLDTMSSSLMCLSMFITALMMFTSTKILMNNNMQVSFMLMCTMLLTTLINAFAAKNLFIFYIWFEASLIPTMLIILLWGYQPERMQASMYMMIYTITASLPMLLMFILLYKTPSSTIMIMSSYSVIMPQSLNFLLIMGFLVKLPMFLFHLWLPKAHVEAPIAGSMILAAILLKLGSYGICRIIMSMHIKIMYLSNMIMSISMIGSVLTSMICLRQTDLKSLIAYSSVGHMGLMVSGTLSYSTWGMYGSLLMMIAHGLCSSALFSLANINYEMYHTRSLYLMKGMLSFLPTMSMWWFIMTAINMAAPPSINLISEIILISATMSFSMFYAISMMLLTFMTGTYSLIMYSATQHGTIINFMNPVQSMNNNKFTMLLAHTTPLIMLTMVSEFSSMWM